MMLTTALLRSSKKRIQLILLLLAGLAASPVQADPVRILLIGDHFIGGNVSHVGFRYDLWFLLQAAGYDVDFVGSKSFPDGGYDLELYPDYSEFDPDHHGTSDAKAAAVAAAMSNQVQAHLPDVVIIMTGLRDFYEDTFDGIEQIASAVDTSINVIRLTRPDATILIGRLPPMIVGGAYVPVVNDRFEEIAGLRSSPESPVLTVRADDGFDQQTMHLREWGYIPNRAGEQHMAAHFFSVLQAVLPEPTGGANFQINAGINDAWYNPATPGQGFFFNVFPDLGLMFVAWFTFDTERPPENIQALLGEPGHRWITGIGPYDGDTANIVLELTGGGVFDSGEPPVMQAQGYGTLDLTFEDCANATATYTIPAAGVSGAIPVQRIVSDNVPLCQSLAGGQAAR